MEPCLLHPLPKELPPGVAGWEVAPPCDRGLPNAVASRGCWASLEAALPISERPSRWVYVPVASELLP